METVAIIAPLILLVYLAVTDWVDLAPWNQVEDLPRKQKIMISIANYTPLLFIALAFALRTPVLVILAVIVALVDFAMHLAYWWKPYFFGSSEAQIKEHQKLFGGTTTFLPAIGSNPIPNAQHVVVGLLMVIMVVSAVSTAIAIANGG